MIKPKKSLKNPKIPEIYPKNSENSTQKNI